MILDERFRAKVEAAMKIHDWKPSELARRMGVDRQYVFRYLKQGVSPGHEVTERFAKALHVDPGNLLDNKELEILSADLLTT